MAMLLRCIDFETSGMPGEGTAAICELGWCDVLVDIGDPTPTAVQCSVGAPHAMFCNPGHRIPAQARAVHHISDADVADYPAPEAALKAFTASPSPPDYYVAHNAPFEAFFFPDTPREIICTYRAAVRLWPDAPGHSNQVLRYWLGLGLDDALAMPPHRAGPDAYVTAHLLARILESGPSIEDLVRWSSGPPLLPRITFGKHRGKKWEEVDHDYLRWVVDKSDLSSDIKANARHWLKRAGENDANAAS